MPSLEAHKLALLLLKPAMLPRGLLQPGEMCKYIRGHGDSATDFKDAHAADAHESDSSEAYLHLQIWEHDSSMTSTAHHSKQ